ncbi:MAG: phosphoribosylamine--glycine ligase [Treponema sp.]|nr:phosphoribosylamine--glycine ligase [Treponema sp.]
MKVMVVGNGGREHTIAWKLAQSDEVEQVICVPGNGGTALENKCKNKSLSEGTYVSIAKEENCSMVVIGPENPLADGLADEFWAEEIPAVGPKKAAAQLEASKDLAKEFMSKYGVACAKSKTFTDENEALAYIEEQGAPIVIKADGLAAGKGVIVAQTLEDARLAVKELMEENKVGDAGKKLVIEEYLRGTEVSILAAVSVTPEHATDGTACIIPFVSARDHKRLEEGAKGPNTGGMGAVAPVDDFTPAIQEQFKKNILEPTLKGLIAEGYDYRGFIFFGLMLTPDGPKCLEYNVRLGDPETQAVLPLMDFDFAKMCKAIAEGTLSTFDFKWKKGYSVAPVAVSGGYPNIYKKGIQISIDENPLKETGAKLFIAGAIEDRRRDRRPASAIPSLITSGGRVLACSAQGETFTQAWNDAYKALACIKFSGMYYRKDIGLPGAAESN